MTGPLPPVADNYDADPAAYGRDVAVIVLAEEPAATPSQVAELVRVRAELTHGHSREFAARAGVAAEIEATVLVADRAGDAS